MNMLRRLGLALSLTLAFSFAGCANTAAVKAPTVTPKATTPAVPTNTGDMKLKACNTAAEEAMKKCNEKCAKEANKDVCDTACKTANDKALAECKK